MKNLIFLIVSLFCIWAILSVLGTTGKLVLDSIFAISCLAIAMKSENLFQQIACYFLTLVFLLSILGILQTLGVIHTHLKIM